MGLVVSAAMSSFVFAPRDPVRHQANFGTAASSFFV